MDLPLPRSWPDAAGHVLPVLRGPTSPANAWSTALDRAEATLVRQPLIDHLDVVVVLDLPELRLFVNHGHLDTWEATVTQVLATSLSNLPPTSGLKPWDVDGIWSLESGDGYASSRLALPGWLAAFRDRVRGDPVAVAPDANTLLVGGTQAGLPTEALLSEGWNRFHASGTPVSPSPMTVDERGRVVPWRPALDHPLVHRVHACHRFGAGHEYRRQQDTLAQWLVDHRIADFLAPFSLMRHASGRVTSLAFWPDGPTLLPQVDLVVLGEPGRLDDSPVVRWDDLVDAGLIQDPEPGLAPIRYRVTAWPIDRTGLPTVDPRTYQPS